MTTNAGQTPAPLRILIVEDEMLIAMMLEEMVEEIGHKVAGTAVNLASGIAMASDEEFDFVILDVNLNGKPSFPIAEILDGRGKPFVFASGYGSIDASDGWKDKPVLRKPFQLEDIENVLQRFFG